MTYFRLRVPELAFREESGTTRFPLPDGEMLRLSPRFRPVLDELACGIPERSWQRLVDDPAFVGLALALSEHRLLEVSETPRAEAPAFQNRSRGASGTGAPVTFGLALLACAAAAFFILRISGEPLQQELPVWAWVFVPVLYALMLILHELGHATAAYSCGKNPRIRLWSVGTFKPRCVLADGTSLSSRQRCLFLAAGPATDAIVLSIAAIAMQSHGAVHWPAMVALCATLAVIANLRPSGTSDMNQILRQIASPRVRRYARAFVAMTLAVLSVFVLETFVRLVVGG